MKVWKLTPFFPSRDRSALTAALNPSAVDGTTISLSALSWAIRPPGQDVRNQARKARLSLPPEINIGVLLGRCPVGRQTLATWAWLVVPSGVPVRGPDMSWNMRLSDVSIETPNSDKSEPMAMGLTVPLGRDWATDPDNTAAYVAPTPDGPGCRLPEAACSPVTAGVAGRARTQHQVLGACWQAPWICPSWLARWLSACPRAVVKHWTRYRLGCCVSLQAPLASSSSAPLSGATPSTGPGTSEKYKNRYWIF